MQKNYNVTGEQRKQMVRIISQAVGMEPVYMRMPTCAYAISNITVGKNGEMAWDGRTDEDVITRVMDALAEAGFTASDPEAEAGTEAEAGQEAETGTEVEAAADAPPEQDSLVIEMPREGFTEEALANLQRIVDSKASLLKKSLGCEDLEICITEEKISFPWFRRTDPESVKAYTHLVSAICRMAKTAKRVTATDRDVDSEKYAFRTWLLRLGFVGAQFKRERSILMENLSGHAAFKNQEDADAFYEKVKAKKAAAKAGAAEETAGEAPGGTEESPASES